MESGADQSLTAFIAKEDALVKEAALALPHSFDKCTYELGPIRQAVYLCLTCNEPRGICSACSVACHGDHEQIELFPKRNFVCDCPTGVGTTNCTLYKGWMSAALPQNTSNVYGQNFHAKFCRCRQPYDAQRERETMVQCLVCEDWFHESCLNLRTRPRERDVKDGPETDTPQIPASAISDNNTTSAGDPSTEDGDSECSNDLPPCLLPASKYDTFICGTCVLANPILRRWAGTAGIMMVCSDDLDSNEVPVSSVGDGDIDPRWKILDDDMPEEIPVLDNDGGNSPRPAKRRRTEDDIGSAICTTSEKATCIAPPVRPLAQKILSTLENIKDGSDPDSKGVIGHGDIFLTKGWRDRWCKCQECLPHLQIQPCLLEEEVTYEPPDDPDSGMSLEQLGMRALLRLPRDRAIDGIYAYNTMRDELIAYLRPFAQEGRVVREQDVRQFFETKLEEQLSKAQHI